MSCNWMTPKEVAEKVGVSIPTVYRWMYKNGLTYYTTPGGTIRICESDLMKEVIGTNG